MQANGNAIGDFAAVTGASHLSIHARCCQSFSHLKLKLKVMGGDWLVGIVHT